MAAGLWTRFTAQKRYPLATMIGVLGVIGLAVGLSLGLPQGSGSEGEGAGTAVLDSTISPPWYPSRMCFLFSGTV